MENNQNNNNNNNNSPGPLGHPRIFLEEEEESYISEGLHNPLDLYSIPPSGGFNWIPTYPPTVAEHLIRNKILDDQDMMNDFLKKKFRESTGRDFPDEIDYIYETNFYEKYGERRGANKTRKNRKKIFKRILDSMNRNRNRRNRNRNNNNNNNNP